MNRINRNDLKMNRVATLMAACGLAFSGATVANAQSDRDKQRDDRKDHMEWSWDDGLHEEEWYDPTDWFDDDFDGIRGPDTDYEIEAYGETSWGWSDDEDYDNETYAIYGDEVYDNTWWVNSDRELYTDGYYDGYFDGYNDDEFGYDYSEVGTTMRHSRAEGYSDGYYDGYYDRMQQFASDWTYYLYTYPVTSDWESSQRERGDDQARRRGDRSADAGTKDMDRRQASRDAAERMKNRMRGTIRSVEMAKDDRLPKSLRDHRVARVKFESGKTALVDFGKKARKGLIEKGDRVTIAGERRSHDGTPLIDVNRLTVNDEVMWNAKDYKKPERMSRSDN